MLRAYLTVFDAEDKRLSRDRLLKLLLNYQVLQSFWRPHSRHGVPALRLERDLLIALPSGKRPVWRSLNAAEYRECEHLAVDVLDSAGSRVEFERWAAARTAMGL